MWFKPAPMMAVHSSSNRGHVERDVVVDDEETARAARGGVADVRR